MGFGMTAKILVGDDEADLRENGRFCALAQPTQVRFLLLTAPSQRRSLKSAQGRL
jgi:hypothetical protein